MTDSDITPTTREIPIVTGELDVDGEPRSPSIAVVILAAGQGTRMRSRLPKVLHPLAGLPLVGHVLATAEELGARHIVTVVRHDRDQVVEVVRALSPQALVVDQDEIPGTGRAVEVGITALPDGFTGQVVVLSGDVPLLDAATLRSLVSAHRQARNDLTLLTARLDDPTGNGRIIRGQDGAFEAIVEQKDATGEQLRIDEVNAGVYVFDAEALRQTLGAIGTDNAQREKYLTDAADVIRRAGGAIEGLPVRDSWLVAGINDRVQLTAAATELNARIIRRWQLAGVTIQDPRTTWIDVKATLAADVTVLPGTQILGASTVAAGATVGPDTTLRDTEVGEDATVRRTDAELAVIGARATVGPFSFLRPGTRLGDDGKIGAYVETKNVEIGVGSKVPHLSYVGDATIGEHTNIGAGAVFANYDGHTKHRTEVGDHVHLGSRNVLVAPVRIGTGSYTGAGAVIRKDVPPGALGISVAPQRNMVGWTESKRPGTPEARAAVEAAEGHQDDPSGTEHTEQH
ncbi:bifunctional UDP-N-acetylglucosamine diphosphorylase/glucosamine-1-phosphate N-acetyltransferase GlmU [Clavibacter michiganensis]|uniref:bifunctional UDP-N-acetylglucosamine diphosphorylase/glucosamine-1-phosphate N-acetyltransferase GlmU n=1 Tax=Clavibacter michiganensis TaxID=28447 RepID=UPI00307A87CD